MHAAQAVWDEGYALTSRSRHRDAFKLYLKAAEMGDAAAMSTVGVCYSQGRGVRKDIEASKRWTRRAWRAGRQTSDLINLSLDYLAQRNRRAALRLLRKASDLGDGDASLDLATLLLKAERVTATHRARAVKLLHEAIRSEQVSEYAVETAKAMLEELKRNGELNGKETRHRRPARHR